MIRLIALAWLTGLMLACQSAPPLSPATAAAMRHHNLASKALAGGDLLAAETGFREAMRQAAALDDWAGEAESRIAWAVSLQRRGLPEDAERALLPIVDERFLPYSLAHQQQALAWRAQWRLAARNWPALAQDLAQLDDLCQSDCHVRALLLSLQAQRAVHENRLADANEHADRALAEAGSDVSETRAYALRVKANIALLSQPEQGIVPIMAALTIDRALGNSAGIFQDLLLRTWLAQRLQAADRIQWLHRTCQVATSLRSPQAEQALQQLPEELWHDYHLSFASGSNAEPADRQPPAGVGQQRCRPS